MCKIAYFCNCVLGYFFASMLLLWHFFDSAFGYTFASMLLLWHFYHCVFGCIFASMLLLWHFDHCVFQYAWPNIISTASKKAQRPIHFDVDFFYDKVINITIIWKKHPKIVMRGIDVSKSFEASYDWRPLQSRNIAIWIIGGCH